jgi:hypothetical protein
MSSKIALFSIKTSDNGCTEREKYLKDLKALFQEILYQKPTHLGKKTLSI